MIHRSSFVGITHGGGQLQCQVIWAFDNYRELPRKLPKNWQNVKVQLDATFNHMLTYMRALFPVQRILNNYIYVNVNVQHICWAPHNQVT